MASITGVGGSVTLPAIAGPESGSDADLHVFSWNATISSTIADDTNFESTGNWKTSIRLNYRLTGTCRATVTTDAKASIFGTAATAGFAKVNAPPSAGFVLQTASGDTYTFSGFVDSVRFTTDKQDRCFADVSYRSSGAVEVAA